MRMKYQLYMFFFLMVGVRMVEFQQRCRFAHYFTQPQILKNPEPFLKEFIEWEIKFIKEVGLQHSTGLTYDGYRLNLETGQLLDGGLHFWTASSKESIHLGIIANSLWKKNWQVYKQDEIFEILAKKVDTYEGFHREYPGFGGFLPWLYLNSSKPYPTTDFASRVPALDNGELFWAAVAVYQSWKQNFPQKFPTLRERFADITFRIMQKNSKKVFFNQTSKKIRAVANIENIFLPTSENLYTNNDNYYLDDPYEGELFNWIATFSDDFSDEEISYMWKDKRKKLKAVEYRTIRGKRVTVEKGWWFSSHEQWKHLFMPYQDVEVYERIMKNKEIARTWHSVDQHICGMYASVTGPASNNSENMDYYSDCGIQSISFNKVDHVLMVTPYASFPVFLVNRTVAAAWLHNMLFSPAGQTIYGGVEATSIDGKLVSPVMTWDSKITTVLAIMGGNADIVREYLKEEGKYGRFREIVGREYELAFPEILEEEKQLAYPSISVQRGRSDFPNCKT